MGQAKVKRANIAAGLEAPPAGGKGAWKRTRAMVSLDHAAEQASQGRVIRSPGPSAQERSYHAQKRQAAKRSLLPRRG